MRRGTEAYRSGYMPAPGGCRKAPLLRYSLHAKPGPVAAQKPRLFDRVRAALRARHYRRRTEDAYIAWIRRYTFFHGKRHPAEMGALEVTGYLCGIRRPAYRVAEF